MSNPAHSNTIGFRAALLISNSALSQNGKNVILAVETKRVDLNKCTISMFAFWLGRIMHYVLQIASLGIATILMRYICKRIAKMPPKDLTFPKTIIALDYLLPRADVKGNSGRPNEEMGRLNKILAAKRGISLAEVDASKSDQHPEDPLAGGIPENINGEKDIHAHPQQRQTSATPNARPTNTASKDSSSFDDDASLSDDSSDDDENPPRKVDPAPKPPPPRKSVEPDPQPLKPPPVKPVPPKKVAPSVEPEPPPPKKVDPPRKDPTPSKKDDPPAKPVAPNPRPPEPLPPPNSPAPKISDLSPDKLVNRWRNVHDGISEEDLSELITAMVAKMNLGELVSILGRTTDSERAAGLLQAIIPHYINDVGQIMRGLDHGLIKEIIKTKPELGERILKILLFTANLFTATIFATNCISPESVKKFLLEQAAYPICALQFLNSISQYMRGEVISLFTVDDLCEFANMEADANSGEYKHRNEFVHKITLMRGDSNFTTNVVCATINDGQRFFDFLLKEHQDLAINVAKIALSKEELPAKMDNPLSGEEMWRKGSAEAGQMLAHLLQKDPKEVTPFLIALVSAPDGEKSFAGEVVSEAICELTPDVQKIAKFLQLGLENGLSPERVGQALIDLATIHGGIGAAIARDALAEVMSAISSDAQHFLIAAIIAENKGVAVRIFDTERISDYLNKAQDSNERNGILLAISDYNSTELNSVLFEYVIDNGLFDVVFENQEFLTLSDGEKTLFERIIESKSPDLQTKGNKFLKECFDKVGLWRLNCEQRINLLLCWIKKFNISINSYLLTEFETLACIPSLDAFNDVLGKIENLFSSEDSLSIVTALRNKRTAIIRGSL
ncbi:MAG: hypothetical protein LBI34_03290 [Puniceicoccales bacterium]|jgi:hypothetical protein|nr:hypothetical protein [Puniceicoccales bacterium]